MKVKHWYYYLSYLLLISLVVTGVSLSRFSSVLNNTGAENTGSPSGTTAPDVEFSTWAIDYEAATFYFDNMLPGDTKTVAIWIKNKSNTGQVSGYNQNVTMELKTTGNLPLYYTLQKTDGTPVVLSHPDTYRYISESQLFIANTEETKAYILTISWPGGNNSYKYTNEIDYIELKLKAVQT